MEDSGRRGCRVETVCTVGTLGRGQVRAEVHSDPAGTDRTSTSASCGCGSGSLFFRLILILILNLVPDKLEKLTASASVPRFPRFEDLRFQRLDGGVGVDPGLEAKMEPHLHHLPDDWVVEV